MGIYILAIIIICVYGKDLLYLFYFIYLSNTQTTMQSFMKTSSSSSKKQLPNNHNQTLTRLRNQRLRKSTSLLGEPDIITVTKIKTTSSFFSKQKKNEQVSEYFINGIIFPTTAHFSTYISSKYQHTDPKSSSNLSIKAKLIMFDAFQEKDVHAQINIPGSLEVKVFNLFGQALKSQPEDYERAYFSSYLRSLKPMNYPNIVLSPYIYKVDTHKQVLRKIIPFCFQNSLRQLKYQIRPIFTPLLEDEYNGNHALQILINFATKNNFWNLVDVIVAEVEKVAQYIELKDVDYLKNRLMFLKKEYARILVYSSELLTSNPTLNEWKQLQIESLYRLRNFPLVKTLSSYIIRRGGTHKRIYELTCMSYLQTKDFHNFLKILNTILTLHNDEQTYIEEISHKIKRLYFMDLTFTKGETISAYPELCFQFDNDFLKRQNKLTQNRSTGEGGMVAEVYGLMDRVDRSLDYVRVEDGESMERLKVFYSLLVKFEKLKGWSQVIKYRGECFWLEIDFRSQQEQILEHSLMMSSTHSLSTSVNKKPNQQQQKPFTSSFQIPSNSKIKKPQSFQSQQHQRSQYHEIQFEHQVEQEFDQAALSEQEDEDDLGDMPPCSKRVSNNANTARRKFFQAKKPVHVQNVKVLCSVTLQKLFVHLYDDLKLQIQLQKWAGKINMGKIQEYSAQKRELIAVLFLKKAFLHMKLERYRKCEQALKQARKICQSALILLVSSYQLILLYMRNSSMKGAEFYIVDLIKVFNHYGIRKFDIVPQWAKEIITHVVEVQGIGILSKLAGPFKELMVRWLRNNHSESSLLKKDSTNKGQVMYKMVE